jgi:hypothetical protein
MHVSQVDPNGFDADATPMPKWEPFTAAARNYINFFDTITTSDEYSEKRRFLIDINIGDIFNK